MWNDAETVENACDQVRRTSQNQTADNELRVEWAEKLHSPCAMLVERQGASSRQHKKP